MKKAAVKPEAAAGALSLQTTPPQEAPRARRSRRRCGRILSESSQLACVCLMQARHFELLVSSGRRAACSRPPAGGAGRGAAC